MGRYIFCSVFILVLSGANAPARAQGLVYGVAGAGGYSGWFGGGGALHAAGGGEVLFKKTAGVGGEVGLFGNSGGAFVISSANGVLHVPMAGNQISPFITGGYSRLSGGEGTFNAWNAGAGVDVWMNNHAGLRLEVRDHVRRDFRGSVHYLSVRAGVAFR